MKCPYCHKEIPATSIFCPECGLSINQEQKSSSSESYWNGIASEDKKRNQEYLKSAMLQRNEAKTQKIKKIAFIIFLFALIACATFITVSITNANKAELETVKSNLIGKELKCSYSRTGAAFWIHYYYYTLKFNSDGTLNYYYMTTVGPAEKDDVPTLKGTYAYTITRNILGDYFISVGNESFTLTVSDDNEPRSLSYGKK